jgi:hypothetical protein
VRGPVATHGTLARRVDRVLRRSILERFAVQPFRPFDRDENGEALLLGVAVLLRLDEALPHLLVDRSRLMDRRRAVEPGDAAFRQDVVRAQLAYGRTP